MFGTTFILFTKRDIKQESRAVARKPRDAAVVRKMVIQGHSRSRDLELVERR